MVVLVKKETSGTDGYEHEHGALWTAYFTHDWSGVGRTYPDFKTRLQ